MTYAFVEHAIDEKLKDDVLADAPVIPHRGSYALANLKFGAKFAACMKDLESVRFRRLVEQKFDVDLTSRPTSIVMMGATSGAYNEGYAHPDSKHKIITVLVGFSREWPYERGRLRVLRSNDRDDYAFEFAPEFGRMLMFRVCDHSWHGFLPQKGKRMSVQLCFVDFGMVRAARGRPPCASAASPSPFPACATWCSWRRAHSVERADHDLPIHARTPGDRPAFHRRAARLQAIGGALSPLDAGRHVSRSAVHGDPGAADRAADARRDRRHAQHLQRAPDLLHPRAARAVSRVREPHAARCSVPTSRASSRRRWKSAPTGSFVRIEYIQDTDGAWLEPHRDIKEKLFSMVLYLCTGPQAKDWGTDIYDDEKRWVGRSSAEFNRSAIFKAGPATWHGFDKRPIVGVRRLMEINYVVDWRDREQLAFPDTPVTTK